MSDDGTKVCQHCGTPAEYQKTGELNFATSGTDRIRKPQFGYVCQNEGCFCFGEQAPVRDA